MDHLQCQLDCVHIVMPYYHKVLLNIFLRCKGRTSRLLSHHITDKIFVCLSHGLRAYYMAPPCYRSWLDAPHYISPNFLYFQFVSYNIINMLYTEFSPLLKAKKCAFLFTSIFILLSKKGEERRIQKGKIITVHLWSLSVI